MGRTQSDSGGHCSEKSVSAMDQFYGKRVNHMELVAVRICSICIGVSSLSRSQSGVASSLCLMVARARSSEERVFPTATWRTMPPLSPVSPACCEPFRVIK
jgi:hypothetical protein